jgi:hypothetical protein
MGIVRVFVLGVALALGACATVPAARQAGGEPPIDIASLIRTGGRVSGEELEKRIAAAQAHPLGSKQNPVRVFMPDGQRAYLARLRYSDGRAPTFNQVGNFGPGVYDSLIDGYAVICATGEPKESMIFMDMYHADHKENAPAPNFTIAPE